MTCPNHARGGNSHGSGMSHAMSVSPEPSFRVPWRVGDTLVSRGNAGWTTSKSGHPCLCQNCSQGPPVEKTGRGFLLNRPSCPPEDPSSQGIELKPCMLLQRLINVRVNSDLVLWVRDVLQDRSQRISVNGQMSEDSEVNSGAPQCCVAPSFGHNTVNNNEHNQAITASNRHIVTLIFQLFRPTCET